MLSACVMALVVLGAAVRLTNIESVGGVVMTNAGPCWRGR